jgi:hypothetical protein
MLKVGTVGMPSVGFKCNNQCGNCCFNLRKFLKECKMYQIDVEGLADDGRERREIISRINLIPLGGVNMFLISGSR